MFFPGYVRYSSGGIPPTVIIAGSVGGAAFLIVLVLVAVGIFLMRRSRRSLDKQAEELELVEKKIQEIVTSGISNN